MDYEGFHLSSPDGLSIIMTAYTTGSKDPFPIDMIYGPWVHTSGQVDTTIHQDITQQLFLFHHNIVVV